MLDKVRARLTWRNAVPVFVMGYVVLQVANDLVDGWDNLGRVPWGNLADLAQHPATLLGLSLGSIVWLVFFGNARQPVPSGPLDYVVHKGLHWRYQTFAPEKVNPYPFCPTHDVKLLWEAHDKSNAVWSREEVSTGMWFSPQHNGKLVCVADGEHEFTWPDDQGWMAREAAKEAAALLEKLRRGVAVQTVAT